MKRTLSPKPLRALATAALALTASWAPPAPVVDGPPTPELLGQLEERVLAATQRAIEVSVGLHIKDDEQPGDGSGVIVTPDGYILTVAHNFSRPGTDIDVVLADGRIVKAKGLGREGRSDFALAKIEGDGPFPYAEMGSSLALVKDELCVMTGHAGGLESGRPIVVRVGAFLGRRGGGRNSSWLRTDCVMMPGDSGGALFDLDGKVVGINSYIEERIDANYHVPIEAYRDNWDRLVAKESWNPAPGDRGSTPTGSIGVLTRGVDDGIEVRRFMDGFPAEDAGVQIGDVIMSVNGMAIRSSRRLRAMEREAELGSVFTLEIRRGDETLTIDVPVEERSRK
ncbi:MAG: trypsin-like peptidase domain-containing protein [Planctomycetota bacterium]